MSYASLTREMWWPSILAMPNIAYVGNAGGRSVPTSCTLDAAGEKFAMIGHVFWADKSGSAKTFSTSSTISVKFGSVTFADASTTLRIGIQDVATSTVTLTQPDGTFDVYADIAGNSGTITSSDDNIVKTLTMTTGTKSITHGDLIAVVLDLTARAGSDSLQILGNYSESNVLRPISVNDIGSGWADLSVSTAAQPLVMLIANDGTRGILKGGVFHKAGATYPLQASTNPNRRGLIFQVPFACKVDSLCFVGAAASASADGSLKLYSTPLGTPTALATVSLLGEQMNNSVNERPGIYGLASEVELSADTDYAVIVEGTGTADITIGYIEMNSADDRTVNGLQNCRGAYRNGDSGAFTESTTILPLCGVGISSVSLGSTGGLLTHPGMAGGMRG
jgi:hypothetical protein